MFIPKIFKSEDQELMKKSFIIFIALFSVFCFGQKDTNWYSYYNSDSTKIGFKDAEGNVKIEPKFEPYITNTVFRNVIAVAENAPEGKFETYYLNKSGKKFGEDFVYMAGTSDYAEDPLEYEGIIKFKNSSTGNVGFFDYNGKVVISDIYNDLTNFHDGIAIGLRGAIWPKCNSSTEDCEHIWWKGGTIFAINTKGEELFELPEIYSNEIDCKHIKINKKVDPEIYTSCKATDGNTYSFNSPEKDFNKWFETVFLPDFKKNKTFLPKYFYELISVDDNDNPKHQTAWKNHKKVDFLKTNQKRIDEVFNQLISGIYQKSVSWETLSNSSYYPENELPKEDLRNNTVISFMARAENDYSSTNSFQFTKIGDSFYITSAP